MAALIPVTGVSSNWRSPGVYVEVAYAQGNTVGNAGIRKMLIVGKKLAAGTYTANTIYRVKKESDVIAGAGQGSELHRMVKSAIRANKTGSIYVLPYAESSGGTPVAAVTTIVLSGTATAAYSLEIEVADRVYTIPFNNTDAAATIAGNARDTLAADLDAPFVVSGSSANITLTHKHVGASGGNASYKPIRIRTNTPGNGITVTNPGHLGSTTAGADGSTTEAANLLTALNANTASEYYYIAVGCGGDTTAMSNVATWLSNQALPLAGKPQVCITGFNGALASGITLANARNYERIQMMWCLATAESPEVVAGRICALHQKYEETDPTYNFDGYSGPDWGLTPYSDQSAWPDSTDINDAIIGGMSPIAARVGATYWVTSTTTRTLDSTGTYMDMRASEFHRVSGADYFAATLRSTLALTMQGAKLAEHPTGADGLPDPNARIPRGVLTPFLLLPTINKVVSDSVDSGQAQKETEMLESVQCLLSEDVPGRVEIGLDYYTIDLAHQATVYIAESTSA